jgi:hypothetical protein
MIVFLIFFLLLIPAPSKTPLPYTKTYITCGHDATKDHGAIVGTSDIGWIGMDK